MKKEDKKKSYKSFKGIHPTAWEHPADRVALNALKKVPGLSTLIKVVFGSTTEKSLRLFTIASAVRVNKKQFPKVHKMYLEVCKTFDVKEAPELFVTQSPILNAGAIGMNNPFITLNSSMLDMLNDNELRAVLGHELGHILSGHVLYKTLLAILLQLSVFAFNIPLSGMALFGIIAALKEWDRKSELSADRAGLIACQDPEVSVHLLMKMAGGGKIKEMDLGEFIKQAEEYKNAKSLTDNIYKVINAISQTHPFPITRTSELLEWVQNGDYEAIINGSYPQEEKAFTEDMKEATNVYQKKFEDTLNPIFDDMKKNTENISQQFKSFFEGFYK